MEEFEISAADLDITTNYNNTNSDFFVYDNSGVCNYQSPTYNTYQNPNYNIFVNQVINNYCEQDTSHFFNEKTTYNDNNFVPEEIFIQKIPTPKQIDSSSDNDKYIVVKTDHIHKTVYAHRMTQKEVIEMLKNKAEKALYNRYNVKIIL